MFVFKIYMLYIQVSFQAKMFSYLNKGIPEFSLDIFTELAFLADSVSKSQCPSVLCVCAIAETPLPGGLETFGQRAYL